MLPDLEPVQPLRGDVEGGKEKVVVRGVPAAAPAAPLFLLERGELGDGPDRGHRADEVRGRDGDDDERTHLHDPPVYPVRQRTKERRRVPSGETPHFRVWHGSPGGQGCLGASARRAGKTLICAGRRALRLDGPPGALARGRDQGRDAGAAGRAPEPRGRTRALAGGFPKGWRLWFNRCAKRRTRATIAGGEIRARAHLTWPVYACVLGNLIFRCASWATAVLLGLYLAHLDRSGVAVPATAVAVLAGAFYVVEVVGAPICGALSDRWGNRVFLLAGPFFGALSAQLMGLTTLLPLLALGRALEGVAVACATPSILAFLAYHTRGAVAYRGRVMGLFELAAIVGIALGGLLAGLLWQVLHVWAFTVVAAIYIGSLGLFASIRAAAPPSDVAGRRLRAYPRLLAQPRLLRFVPAWGAVNAIIGVWATFLPFMLAGRDDPQQWLVGGFSGGAVGLVFVGIGIAFGSGVLLWSLAIGRLGVARVMLAGLLALYGLAVVLWLLNRTTGWPVAAQGALALAVIALIGAGSGFTPAALTYLAQLAEEHPAGRGAVMGLYSVFFGLGQLAGGALGSPFLAWAGADGLILLTALLTTMALATVVALVRLGELRAGAVARPPLGHG